MNLYCKGPAVLLTICKLTVQICEHLGITYWEGVDAGVWYTERILKGSDFNKYQAVTRSSKKMVTADAGNNQNCGEDSVSVSMKYFWGFSKAGGLDNNILSHAKRDTLNFSASYGLNWERYVEEALQFLQLTCKVCQ